MMPRQTAAQARNYVILLIVLLLLGAAISLYTNLRKVDSQYKELAEFVGRSLFQALEGMRDWNTQHQGVYVPISSGVVPNEHLADPLRDITSTQGLQLTKINHAQMIRMISELLNQPTGVHVHMTSLTPIRPENAPDPWEARALAGFASVRDEAYGVQNGVGGRPSFRYMAPLEESSSCLTCHHEDKSGNEIRGGISVSFSFAPFQQLMDEGNRQIWLVHLMGVCAAVVPIAFLGRKLVRNVDALQASLRRVRQLEGLVPICANCKKIRTEGADADVQKSWIPMELYIEERTHAEFTHGICPDCREKLYPGFGSGGKG
ncbi:MAG: DUF3365 domain-containing protein [Acidobacteriota bacterium]|jgi:hypothetical protein